LKKKDLTPGQRYTAAYLKYLNVFLELSISTRKNDLKKYYAALRNTFIIIMNNTTAFKDNPSETEIKLFIRTNQYCKAEYGRIIIELLYDKIINQTEYELLYNCIKGFMRECIIIQNIIIRKEEFNEREFKY